ncbi:MAG: HD domain-containing phosphohydrolase [Myxococcota bacterium]
MDVRAAERILFVDDEDKLRDVVLRQVGRWGMDCMAVATAEEGLEVLEADPEAFGVLLVDLHLEEGTGLDLLAHSACCFPWVSRVLVSGNIGVEDAVDAVNRARVHRVLGKPWSGSVLRETLRRSLERAYLGLLTTRERPGGRFAARSLDLFRPLLLRLAEAGDGKAGRPGESLRIGLLARGLAEALDLPERQRDISELAGLSLELGQMLAAPEDHEDTISLESALRGGSARLLSGVPGLEDVAEVVTQYPERFDGLGHPKGLQGRAIRLEARVLHIARGLVRLAEASNLPVESWLAHLELGAGAQYDPELLARLRSQPIASWAGVFSP